MPGPDLNDGDGPPPDWRSLRREEREERRQQQRAALGGRGSAWIGGVVLIFVGVIFLAKNFGLQVPEHWWALFLLIPAVAALTRAAAAYRANGRRLDGTVVAALAGGLMFVALTVIFLVGADWKVIWPVMLIVIGIGALARGMVASRH